MGSARSKGGDENNDENIDDGFGVSPHVESFSLKTQDSGGGLRLIDARVKAIRAHIRARNTKSVRRRRSGERSEGKKSLRTERKRGRLDGWKEGVQVVSLRERRKKKSCRR